MSTATITAADINKLRQATGAGMMDCRKALTETNGDFEAAIDWLRKQGQKVAAKRSDREAKEGVIIARTSADNKVGFVVCISCETDFVSKNELFLAFCNHVASLIVKNNPADVAALGELPLSMEGFGPTVEEVRKGLIGKIGENLAIRRFKRYSGGGQLAAYLHGVRIGVMVEFEGDATAAKDTAMHIAAMKPVALSVADVPAELVAKERSVAEAKAAESGKPADIAAKMIEGAVQKYLKEVSLFNQTFVKNDKQTIEQMLKAANTTVKGFTLYIVGEGIEKRQDDFAAEVAAQVAAAQNA